MVKVSAEEFAHFLKKVRFGSNEVYFKFDDSGLEVYNSSNSEVGIVGFLNKDVFESIDKSEFVIPDLKMFTSLLSRFRTSKVKIDLKENYLQVTSKHFQVDLPIMRKEYFKQFSVSDSLEPLFDFDIDTQRLQDVLSVLSVAKGDDIIISFKKGIMSLQVVGIERITARLKVGIKVEKHIKLNLKKFIAILSLFTDETHIAVYDNFVLLKDMTGISSIFYYLPALVVDTLESMVLEKKPEGKAKDLQTNAGDFDVEKMKKVKKNKIKKGKKALKKRG